MTRRPAAFIVAAMDTYETTPHSFDVAGETCAASIHRPLGAERYTAPGVVLVHGFACTRNMRLEPYVAALTGAGLAVLTYDPRNTATARACPATWSSPIV